MKYNKKKKNLFLRSKRNVERLYKMKTPNTFWIYFHLLFSKGKYWHVYRAEVTYLIPNTGEMDFSFFSIIILSCIIGYCVISVSKGSNK